MNIFERTIFKVALNRIRAKLKVKTMKTIIAIGSMLAGAAVVLAAASHLIQHFVAGDLFAQTCNNSNVCQTQLMVNLAELVAGIAMFSPGVPALKAGPFARPTGTEGAPPAEPKP